MLCISAVKFFVSQGTLRMIYFSYIHSSMPYGTIVWNNSSYSINTFKIPKKKRVITNSRSRDSCPGLFKKLNVIPLQSLYIYIYIYLFYLFIYPLIICDQELGSI